MKNSEQNDLFGAVEGQTYVTTTIVKKSGYMLRVTTLDGVVQADPLGNASWETFSPEGLPMYKVWHAFGVVHRADGPAEVVYHTGTSQPMTEVYMYDGVPRPEEDGPYIVRLNTDGSIWRTENADPNRTYSPETQNIDHLNI